MRPSSGWAPGHWRLDVGRTEANDSVRAIHAALDAGINLIDTAPAYGFGLSEKIVGQAIRGRRDRVCWHQVRPRLACAGGRALF